MLEVVTLTRDQWTELRDIRLTALRDSPSTFLAQYDHEQEYDANRWQAEFNRGDWHVGFFDGAPASLLGTTREPGMPEDHCYLEYLWVSPGYRRSGLASEMISVVLSRMRTNRLRSAFLWILDGNEVATQLYKSLGFVSTNYRQPLPGQDDRYEELMRLDLSDGPPEPATGT